MTLGSTAMRAVRRAVTGFAVLALTLVAGRLLLADATPQTLPFTEAWTNIALLATDDDWTLVPGVQGFRGDNLTAATGADPQLLTADDDPGVADVTVNQVNPNTFATGGVAEFHLADPVVALNGSGTADAPYLRLTLTTTGIDGVRVRYNLRDLDGSVDNAIQPVALHYRVGTTGAWTNVPAAFVADATSGPSLATLVTPVDVVLPVAVNNQAAVQVRIMTSNAVGNDEWVGVDDIVIEPATAPTAPSFGTASASPNPVEQGQAVVISATVAPGTNPASTSFIVTADTTALGGAASMPLLDDGIAPDTAAGDLVFSGATTIAANAGLGALAVPLAVVDDLQRAGSGQLTVQVTAPVPELPIGFVQGPGATSPFVGQTARVRGVVTARRSNGLYLQSPPMLDDGAPSTSDGIFVFTQTAPPASLVEGVVVLATGTVTEFVPAADPNSPSVTELTSATFVEIGTSTLPAPFPLLTLYTDPAGGPLQLEPFEGMLVYANALTVVAPSQGTVNEATATATTNGVFYGVLAGLARPVREPGIAAMDPELPCAAGTGCAIPVFDQNPERLRVDSDAIVGVPPVEVTTGAQVMVPSAVLDYGFRTWTLLPTVQLIPTRLAVPTPARPPAASEFTVASFNLQRFFDTVNDPSTSDAVLTPAAYDTRLSRTSLAMRDYLHAPDVVGVQEAENLQVLRDLAARIDADAANAGQTPPGYQAILAEGNDIGGIDVGFLVSARVTVHTVVQHGRDDTFVDPTDGSVDVLNDRPSLSLRATIAAAPGTLPAEVVVVVNHLRSLNDVADPVAGPRVRAKRLAQAEYVARLLDGLRASYPGVPIVSVGDYNAFEVNDGYVDVLGIVRGAPAPATEVVAYAGDLLTPDFLLASVVAGTPADATYSYSFDGNAQSLDHVLLSADAATALAGFDHARVNADFPEIYRGWPGVARTSDHDPAIAYFRFPTDTTAPVVTVPADSTTTAQGPYGAVVTFTATAVDDTAGSVPVTCVPASGALFAFGSTRVHCSAVDGFGNTGAASFTVSVVDSTTAGLLAGASTHGAGTAGVRVIFTAARTSTGDDGAAVLAEGRAANGRPALFVATAIDGLAFFDDPASSPGPWPASGIDTVRVTGRGVVNGASGFTFALIAVDCGEPGRGRDAVSFTVWNSAGQVVLQSSGAITAGNVDSLPIW